MSLKERLKRKIKEKIMYALNNGEESTFELYNGISHPDLDENYFDIDDLLNRVDIEELDEEFDPEELYPTAFVGYSSYPTLDEAAVIFTVDGEAKTLTIDDCEGTEVIENIDEKIADKIAEETADWFADIVKDITLREEIRELKQKLDEYRDNDECDDEYDD